MSVLSSNKKLEADQVPSKRRSNSKPSDLLRGFAMGIADIIPGISGGSIALILGIYSKLVENISNIKLSLIKSILLRDWETFQQKIDITFLIRIFMGILLAVLVMARVMSYLLSQYPTYTWSFFFGLILFSTGLLFFQTKLHYLKKFPLFIIGIIIAVVVVKLKPVNMSDSMMGLFFSGMFASVAMILPGISGSLILLILGKYEIVINAVKNPLVMDSLLLIIPFSIGVASGLISFSKVLNWALARFEASIIVLLTGFMAGSLVKVWPWREIEDVKFIGGKLRVLSDIEVMPAFDQSFFLCLLCMALGSGCIFMVQKLNRS
jgi:putative membrane protein